MTERVPIRNVEISGNQEAKLEVSVPERTDDNVV